MNNTRPIMTVFAGTNGAGKSTISLQMREWLGELVDIDNTYEPAIVAEIINGNLHYCVESIPDWSRTVLVRYR